MNKIYILGLIIIATIFGYWFISKSNTKSISKEQVKIISADAYNNKKNNNGDFLGEKGETIIISNNQIQIPINGFEINKIRYFNTELDGKKIYYMVAKDASGTYRAAANACEVCFGARKGFRQEGEFMICNNCQNRFALNTLGVIKGGCNPGPISSNIKVDNNQLIINSSELAQVANLF